MLTRYRVLLAFDVEAPSAEEARRRAIADTLRGGMGDAEQLLQDAVLAVVPAGDALSITATWAE
jgi:hypothetical protein